MYSLLTVSHNLHLSSLSCITRENIVKIQGFENQELYTDIHTDVIYCGTMSMISFCKHTTIIFFLFPRPPYSNGFYALYDPILNQCLLKITFSASSTTFSQIINTSLTCQNKIVRMPSPFQVLTKIALLSTLAHCIWRAS